MQKLIFVRHGQTKKNFDGLYCGWSDDELTEEGENQAEVVAQKLKEEKITKIYCSNLKRTMQTAERINQYHGVEIRSKKNLREMNFGLWEGKKYSELKSEYEKDLSKWEKDWIHFIVPKGESLMNMHERVCKEMDEIVDDNKEGTLVVVSHAGCIRAILSRFIGSGIEDYWKYKVENCKITSIEILEDGFAVLTGLNI